MLILSKHILHLDGFDCVQKIMITIFNYNVLLSISILSSSCIMMFLKKALRSLTGNSEKKIWKYFQGECYRISHFPSIRRKQHFYVGMYIYSQTYDYIYNLYTVAMKRVQISHSGMSFCDGRVTVNIVYVICMIHIMNFVLNIITIYNSIHM